MSDSIGKVRLDLEANTGQFQSQVQGLSGKATSIVKTAFMGFGKVFAGIFATTALVSFGKASINLASNLAEVQNVVDVVFGNSAEQVNNFAKSALNAYGLSELSAKKYTSTMGAMLNSMGLSKDSVLSMSQSITALTGDMASFYNLDSDAAFQKIRAGISGETEPLKQLGINMSVTNMEAYAMSQGITKSYQSMTQSEQALLRYNYLLSVTSDAQGDFARTSDSWANQTRILSESFDSIKATMGSAFITMLTPVVRLLNILVAKLQIAANYFKAFVEAITGTKAEANSASSSMGDIADSATEAGDAAVEAAKKAKTALAGFDQLNVLSQGDSGVDSGLSGLSAGDFDMSSFENMAIPEPDMSGVERVIGKVKGLFASLKDYVTGSFAPSIKAWGGAFSGLKKPVQDACFSMGNSLKTLWTGSFVPLGEYLLGDFIPNVANGFSETVAPIFTDLLSSAITNWASLFEFACQAHATLMQEVLIPALDGIKQYYLETFQIISDGWANSGKSIIEGLAAMVESIKTILTTFYTSVLKPIWDEIVSAVSTFWEKHLKGLYESIVGFVLALVENILVLWNNVLAPLLNWLLKQFGPPIKQLVNTLLKVIIAVFGPIVDAIGNLFNALKGLLNFLTGVFTGDWKKAWEGIKSVFENIWKGIVNGMKAPVNLIIGIINTLVEAVEMALNWIVGGINKISFKVPDWVPGIGGKGMGFNLSKAKFGRIPYLAEGGIIDQPTLAMVGEKGKEAVVPLENTAFADSIANAILRVLTPLLNGSSNIGRNNDGTQVIVLKVGEYELGRVTVGAINKYHNVVGKVELEV